jgi:hypothetical protein
VEAQTDPIRCHPNTDFLCLTGPDTNLEVEAAASIAERVRAPCGVCRWFGVQHRGGRAASR